MKEIITKKTTTTPSISSKKVLQKIYIEQLIKQYLLKKGKISQYEKELKQIKLEIDESCNMNIENFVEGVWELKSGKVKMVKNPPKMVDSQGKSLSTEERKDLSLSLPKEFIVNSIDLKKIVQQKEKNKILSKMLEAKEIEVSQTVRYDVKPH